MLVNHVPAIRRVRHNRVRATVGPGVRVHGVQRTCLVDKPNGAELRAHVDHLEGALVRASKSRQRRGEAEEEADRHLAHRAGQDEDRIEAKGLEFQARVAEGYRRFVARSEVAVLVDATGSADEVAERVWREVQDVL